jgi:3-deoxy-D-manno-octulosonic-acid transferase
VLLGLKEVEPRAKLIVSFFSTSGYQHVNDESIDCKIYLPLDFYWTVKSALRLVRPEKLIFAAYDIWPNLIWAAKELGIPTVLFAARFKKGTGKLLPVVRNFYHHVYKNFHSIYTITKTDHNHLQLMLENSSNTTVRVFGNPRYDHVKSTVDKFTTEHTKSVLSRKKRIIFASIHDEDERIIYESVLRLLNDYESLSILWVPHEPIPSVIDASVQRFEELGFKVSVFSKQTPYDKDDPKVIVVDVVGVLSHLYWDGIIAYVGGGFSTGIHNVMEPAIARLPILFGPKYKNFHEAEELIKSGGGWSIENGEELFDKINILLSDDSKIIPASFAATDVIHRNVGAATRVVRGIIRD